MTLRALLDSRNLFIIIENPPLEGESKDDYERVKNRLKLFFHYMEKIEYQHSGCMFFRRPIGSANHPEQRSDYDAYDFSFQKYEYEKVEDLYPKHLHLIEKIRALHSLHIAQYIEKTVLFYKEFKSIYYPGFSYWTVFLADAFKELLSYLTLAKPAWKLLNYLPLPNSELALRTVIIRYEYQEIQLGIQLGIGFSEFYGNLFSKIAFTFDWFYRHIGKLLGFIVGIVVVAPITALFSLIGAGYFYRTEKNFWRMQIIRRKEALENIPLDPEREALLMGLHSKNKNSSALGHVFSTSEINDTNPLNLVFQFLSGPSATSTQDPTREEDAPERKSEGALLQTLGNFSPPLSNSRPSTVIAALDEETENTPENKHPQPS